MSERFFLSMIILLDAKPLISLEYETFSDLDAALILDIQRDLKALFLFFLSLNAYCKDFIFDCFAVLYNLLLAP